MWYIHQTCTNCSSWLDLLILRGDLCPWPTFHAWVTMVRKKWLSLYYSTYWCYIHQTCTNCSSWYDLLIPCGGLCPWPTFYAWVTMVRKKWLRFYQTRITWLRSLSAILPLFWRHDIANFLTFAAKTWEVLLSSWDTWRFPAKLGYRSTKLAVFTLFYNKFLYFIS